ncbi:hypothetical protein HYV57_04580 [Candidatus Peregrinibacteria bacterium]|nr:hypothetical protein [Candidatus Peregrinibacteria bacterium]
MKIFFTEHFKRQLKKLKKKYFHVKEDFLKEMDFFDINRSISIGRSIYKIRIRSNDISKGKSGGFRCYLYLYMKKNVLVPLCIYAKSDIDTLTDNELQYHFNQVISEILAKF